MAKEEMQKDLEEEIEEKLKRYQLTEEEEKELATQKLTEDERTRIQEDLKERF